MIPGATPVTVAVPVVAPAGMFTGELTVAIPVAALISVTETPPDPAGPDKVTVESPSWPTWSVCEAGASVILPSTVKVLPPVAASEEVPAGVVTVTTRTPRAAVDAMLTEAVRLVPPELTLRMVAVMFGSAAPTSRNVRAVAPVRFDPVTARVTLVPWTPEVGSRPVTVGRI